MNIDGWIPREMILGPEAEMRVPAEFIVQMDKTANPPMFFYLIHRFLDDEEVSKSRFWLIKLGEACLTKRWECLVLSQFCNVFQGFLFALLDPF